jgi:hypothetical protein
MRNVARGVSLGWDAGEGEKPASAAERAKRVGGARCHRWRKSRIFCFFFHIWKRDLNQDGGARNAGVMDGKGKGKCQKGKIPVARQAKS